MSSLEALAFFCGPDLFVTRGHFRCVDIVLGFAPSVVSSSPCPMDKFGPPSSCVVVYPISCVTAALSTTFAFSAVALTAMREPLTSATNYSLHFCWANWLICSLVASFYFCVVVLSCSARSGARHSGGHDSSKERMASSIVMKGSLVQFCIGSLCALICTLCISALKFAKLRRLLYSVGDRHGLLLIHIQTLVSMST